MTSSPAGLEASTAAAIVASIALLAMVVANVVDAGAREAFGVLLLVPAARNAVLLVRGARDERIWAGVGLVVMALVLVVLMRA